MSRITPYILIKVWVIAYYGLYQVDAFHSNPGSVPKTQTMQDRILSFDKFIESAEAAHKITLNLMGSTGDSDLSELSKPVSPPSMSDMIAPRALLGKNMGIINQYGCWCYFEQETFLGKGQPKDKIDQLCKDLHFGYECIMLDSLDEDSEHTHNDPISDQGKAPCIPWKITYNSAFNGGYNPLGLKQENLIRECERVNPVDSCQAKVCKVEGWFLNNYVVEAIFKSGINKEFSHKNGFDSDLECSTGTGEYTQQNERSNQPMTSEKVEKSCCGFYPKRFSYRLNGVKECCQRKLYNPTVHECCSDGSAMVSCLWFLIEKK